MAAADILLFHRDFNRPSDLYCESTNAGNGTFYISGEGGGGHLIFDDSSSAADGVFTVDGFLEFDQDSSAGNATITANPAACPFFCGVVQFDRNSTAANATLVANGGIFKNRGKDAG